MHRVFHGRIVCYYSCRLQTYAYTICRQWLSAAVEYVYVATGSKCTGRGIFVKIDSGYVLHKNVAGDGIVRAQELSLSRIRKKTMESALRRLVDRGKILILADPDGQKYAMDPSMTRRGN